MPRLARRALLVYRTTFLRIDVSAMTVAAVSRDKPRAFL
jgi:hypothetical protein